MATRTLLAELAIAFSLRHEVAVSFQALGGVEAARRVLAGEPFDLVVLASDAIDRLAAAGKVDSVGRIDLFRSGIGVAVQKGLERPDVSTGEALRHAVLQASSIGYSTGPSGVALMGLFERWGIADKVRGRLVQASPGVAVGSLMARGEVAIGFQQMSELLGIEGIQVLGSLPPEIQIETVFSAASTVGSTQLTFVRAFTNFVISSDGAEAARRCGMEIV